MKIMNKKIIQKKVKSKIFYFSHLYFFVKIKLIKLINTFITFIFNFGLSFYINIILKKNYWMSILNFKKKIL